MSFDQQELQQYRGRTRANLYHGPTYGAYGHYPSVQQTSVTEIPFEDSESALRFMNQIGRKDPDARVLKMQGHSRFISRGDER